MKKILITAGILMALGILSTAQMSPAHHHTRYLDTQQRYDIFNQPLEQNGGYKSIQQTQATNPALKETQRSFVEDNNSSFTNIMNAKKMGNDSYVVLKGKIVSKAGKGKYLFKDSTGTIEIEIDDDIWGKIQPGTKETVIIKGRIDKDWNTICIDVETIESAK